MISISLFRSLVLSVVVRGDLSRRWRMGGLSLMLAFGRPKRVFQGTFCAPLLASYGTLHNVTTWAALITGRTLC